jgi:hypothetical protein
VSTITELNPRRLALTEAGVSVWLDQIRRSMVEGGELARMRGRFLQLVDGAPRRDAEIPGAGYSFGTLIAAQSAGNLETLRGHGRPVERVEVEGDPAEAVRALTERITVILQES